MIQQFEIKNFLSITQLHLDFNYAEGKAPNGFRHMECWPFFTPNKDKIRIVPCLALVGPNASGKTNILKAFETFRNLISLGIYNNYRPNKLHPELQTTTFSLTCFVNEPVQNQSVLHHYDYTVEYSDRGIIQETLKRDKKCIYAIHDQQLDTCNIATETYTSHDLNDILQTECSDLVHGAYIQRRTFLSLLRERYAKLSPNAVYFHDYLKTMLILPNTANEHIQYALRFLAQNNVDEQQALNSIYEMIRKFDVGIEGIEVRGDAPHRRRETDFVRTFEDALYNRKYYVTMHRDARGDLVPFDLEEESSGTRVLINVVGLLFLALNNGWPVIVDELEKSLHPFIVDCLIRLFKDKDRNPHGAQLIFSSHTTDILDGDLMRISEIAFVDKNLKAGTILRRLVDFEGVRNVVNFRKNYRDGAYGGIPFPYI